MIKGPRTNKRRQVKRIFLLPLALTMALSQVGCDLADNAPVRKRPESVSEVERETLKNMKINLKLPEKTLTATLADTPTARDFASLLPLRLTLEDYSKTEKISDLPKKLTTEGAPAGADPSVGDVAYYAPWGNLALFYKDFDYSTGLIILGKLDGGAEALNMPGSVKVTIELRAATKEINHEGNRAVWPA